MVNFDFQILATQCKELANKFNTMVEIRSYHDYGWASICYMTDKFGGVYANVHVDLNTGVMTLNYDESDAFIIKNIDVLEGIIFIKMNDELKNRDMDALGEFINSQYD